ncbi:MAG: tripartite tricarboxylate transporter substrate binding protein [Rhodospirillales bacterium]|nr:tripartite tricarboxylate transporter substrate binding protein [Rhodospirillales bacterium]MBO6786192.1 tripartite tricarboxylate transporter substrate binding protein [Rhodospirillales bacterium]
MRLFIPVIAALALLAGPAHAEWAPKGPIKFWIGFGAGGGTDTQARALAEELEALKGWRIIPENKAGGGGAVMAAQLKNEPADGQTLGLAINTTFDFATIGNENISIDDFTYITMTAGSQMAVLARADSGWKSLDDMVKAAKSGTKIVWANWGNQVQAGAEMVARHYGIEVNHLRGKGGKSAINALVAKDANVGWGGGVQGPLVAAGELVILASAEPKPLVQAPDQPTLIDLGVMETGLGFQFVLAGPKGMSADARDTIAAAIHEVLKNPESKTAKFVTKQYPPGPLMTAGDALTAQLKKNLESNKELVKLVK